MSEFYFATLNVYLFFCNFILQVFRNIDSLSNFSDTRHPETELEANATYSKILQSSDHQKQQGHPGQVENSGDLILNQNSDLHDPQQLHSPDTIQQFNQSGHFEESGPPSQSQQQINSIQNQQLNNSGMFQQLNQSSHLEEPEHSGQSQQQTADRELIISGKKTFLLF